MGKEIKTLQAMPFVFAGNQLRIRTEFSTLERAGSRYSRLFLHISI